MGKIEELIEGLENVSSKSINKDFEDGYNGGIRHALGLVKEYKSSLPTQQDKVVVPKFVSEWYEKHKDNLEYSIYSLHVEIHCRAEESEFENWVINTKNKPIETLIRMKDGYTVEKEQLYYVQLAENLIFLENIGNKNTSEKYATGTKFYDRYVYKGKFTEQEIKATDERYWAFAVPVEEDE